MISNLRISKGRRLTRAQEKVSPIVGTAHILNLAIIPSNRSVTILFGLEDTWTLKFYSATGATGAERIQVLDSNEQTLLLGRGRRLMERLGQVTFDWVNGRIKWRQS